ncbi:hypothetical protein GYB62_02140, partial [bacterium]|nr:hypothetical protein [bacterium]
VERGAVDSRALDTTPTAEAVAEETKLAFANSDSVPIATSSSLQKEQAVAEIKQMPKAPTAAQIDRQINKRAISVRQSSGDAAAKALLIREIGKRYDLPDSAAQLLALQLVSNDASSMAPLVQQYAKAFPEQQRFAVLLIRYYIDTAQMNKIDQVITGLPASLRADQKIMELYAAALQQRGDYSASAKVYAQLLVKDGGNGRWWMAYAVALDASQDTGQAKQAYQRALATGQLDTTLSQYASQRLAMML